MADGAASSDCVFKPSIPGGGGKRAAGEQVNGAASPACSISAAAEPGLGLMLLLFHLELAEDRLEADEQLVPVGFHVAQGILVHLAQKPYGRSR